MKVLAWLIVAGVVLWVLVRQGFVSLGPAGSTFTAGLQPPAPPAPPTPNQPSAPSPLDVLKLAAGGPVAVAAAVLQRPKEDVQAAEAAFSAPVTIFGGGSSTPFIQFLRDRGYNV